ncbi:permease [Murimonas intestini]|uniref:ABC-2 type transport system permease protein n=1 Tax=Murimonas intestini TaxID=1337051 RepID=A0AB73T7U8_9FIRM|nr:permease [Murimonas intestini]MCR1839706.1 hypothetical protein [Murimonas intestini]MCR1866549.1 hypothetical protein [Murimonas intestini]MCR1884827.1 hypothetical protein [Murimonas intestini]
MKSKCFLLFKVQFFNQVNVKSKAKSQVMVMVSMGILGVILAIYSYMIGYGLGSMGMAEVIPSYALAITSIVTLFFTAIKANGVLFAYKDYDILMALPVKTSTVIASRFLTMYVLNLIFTALVMVPMGISYIVWQGPGFLFYPVWIAGLLAAPLVPTTIATLLGALIILFTSRFKYANILTTVVSLAAMIAVVLGSFSLGGVSDESIDISAIKSVGEFMLVQINRIYPLASLFHKAVVKLDMVSFLIYLVISAGWYYLFVKVLSLRYKKMNTGLMTYHTRSDYKMTSLSAGSPLKALWKKEMKRFFSSTPYILNMGMGIILAVVFSIACLFVGRDQIGTILNMPGIQDVIGGVLPFVVSMLGCMSCTTSVSLSLEGKSIGILKSLPVSPELVYKSKILMNLTLILPAMLISSACLAICFPQSLPGVVLIFVTPLVYGTFTSIFGMFVNIKMPNYEWTNEISVIKQSMSSMAGIFGGMINGGIPIIILVVFKNLDPVVVGAIFTAAEAVLSVLLFGYLKKLRF